MPSPHDVGPGAAHDLLAVLVARHRLEDVELAAVLLVQVHELRPGLDHVARAHRLAPGELLGAVQHPPEVDAHLGVEHARRDRAGRVDDGEHRRRDHVAKSRVARGVAVVVHRLGLADRVRVLADLLEPDLVGERRVLLALRALVHRLYAQKAEAMSSSPCPASIARSKTLSTVSMRGASKSCRCAASRTRRASLRIRLRLNEGGNSRSTIIFPFSCAYAGPSGPPSMVCRNCRGSMSIASANAIVSASESTSVASQAFSTSFSRVPSPASPSSTVFAPTASSTGLTRSRASRGPEARTTRSPCSAGCLVPETGASTNATPRSSAIAASRSLPAIPTVLICSQTASSPSESSVCPATSATTSPSGSIVSIASAPATASAGVSATSRPVCSARSWFRFQTRTAIPASATLRAIGAPIVPVPSTATTTLAPAQLARRGLRLRGGEDRVEVVRRGVLARLEAQRGRVARLDLHDRPSRLHDVGRRQAGRQPVVGAHADVLERDRRLEEV